MKQLLMVGVLSGMVLAPAYAEGVYGGIGVANARSIFDDSDKYGPKLFGGYDFTQHWGIEAGFARGPLDEYTRNYPEFGPGVYMHQKNRTQSLYVAAKGTLPMNDRFSLFTKLGLSHTRIKIDINGSPTIGQHQDTQSNTGLYVGIGARYQLTQKLGLTLEVERHSRTPYYTRKPESVSLNAIYSF